MTEIDRLRRDCAEAYQVVGALASAAGLFNDPAVNKALDNLAAVAVRLPRRHDDLLPFFVPGAGRLVDAGIERLRDAMLDASSLMRIGQFTKDWDRVAAAMARLREAMSGQ